MLKKTLLILFFVGSLNCFFSQDTTVYKLDITHKTIPFGLFKGEFSNKPKLGLVLSGGGSRGLSQIGVLKAFEEFNVPIDYIVGTSMGSIVGGMYSSGYSLPTLDSIVTNTNWDNFFSVNEANRRELFIDQKITEDKAIFSLRFDGLTPVIPISIATGQQVSNFLSLLEINAPLHFNKSFSDLLYNYRAVATDLISGKPVVLSQGSLGKAMRASSSISLLLSPVKLDSLLLVDGGLVANVPANIAHNLGSDVIVAVNATSPLNSREDLIYPWNVADQMISIPMIILTNDHIENADFVINPNLGKVKNSDFSNLRPLINQGYNSSLPLMDSIKNYYKSSFLSAIGYSGKEIDSCNFIIEDKEIKDKVNSCLSTFDKFSINELFYCLYNVYDSGNYKDIWFELIQHADSNTIIVYSEKNATIKSIEINGITQIDLSLAYNIFSSLINKPYNSQNILKKTLDLLSLYRTKGFSLAEIRNINFDQKEKILSIQLTEGIIDKIKIEGNTTTNDAIILREFPFKIGDYFQYSQIEKGLIGLRSSNIFEEIDISIIKEDSANIFVIKVIERNPAVLRFGLRIDNENQAQISLDLRDENFYGTGTEFGITFSGGVRNRLVYSEYKANRIFNTFFTYKLKGYYDLTDINTYQDDTTKYINRFKRSQVSEYRQVLQGVSFAIGSQAGKLGNFMIEGRYEQNEIKNKIDYYGTTFKLNIFALKFDLTFDTQDRFPYPKSGLYFRAFYETASQKFGGDLGYTKFLTHYTSAFTIANRHTLTPKIIIGFADETLPLSQQFSFGGQNSFLGYRDYEYRGRQIFISSLEYRYSLPIKLFFDAYVKFRYDLGSIWESKQQMRLEDFKHGIGTTLSIDTPIGPADFTVGRSFYFRQPNVNNVLTWGEIFFYFTIGYAY